LSSKLQKLKIGFVTLKKEQEKGRVSGSGFSPSTSLRVTVAGYWILVAGRGQRAEGKEFRVKSLKFKVQSVPIVRWAPEGWGNAGEQEFSPSTSLRVTVAGYLLLVTGCRFIVLKFSIYCLKCSDCAVGSRGLG